MPKAAKRLNHPKNITISCKTNKESFVKGTTKSTFYITAADVKALYPSLQRHLVNEAIEDALKKHSCYNRIVREIIAELNNICLENVIAWASFCNFFLQLPTAS